MATPQVTVSDLIHRTGAVFERLEREGRLEITRSGRLAGTLIAPDAGERLLDEWAGRGEVSTDWRERQRGMRQWLRQAAERATDPTDARGSEAILADREETDR